MAARPQLKSMLHVSLLVLDLARARHFYESVLGLQPSPLRPRLGIDGIWYELGAQQIHLLVSETAPQAYAELHGGRDRHVAFAIEDLDAFIATLENNQIAYARSASGRRALFCRDPDGNALEFSESRAD